jgi:plastin-1
MDAGESGALALDSATAAEDEEEAEFARLLLEAQRGRGDSVFPVDKPQYARPAAVAPAAASLPGGASSEEADTERGLLLMRVQQLSARNRSERRRFAYIVNAGRKLELENAEHVAEIARLRDALRHAREEADHCRESADAYRRMVDALQSKEKSLRSAAKGTEESLADRGRHLEVLQRQNDELVAELEALRREFGELKQSRSGEIKDRFKERREGLLKILDGAREQALQHAREQARAAEEQVAQRDQQIEALQLEAAQLRAEIENLRRQLQWLQQGHALHEQMEAVEEGQERKARNMQDALKLRRLASQVTMKKGQADVVTQLVRQGKQLARAGAPPAAAAAPAPAPSPKPAAGAGSEAAAASAAAAAAAAAAAERQRVEALEARLAEEQRLRAERERENGELRRRVEELERQLAALQRLRLEEDEHRVREEAARRRALQVSIDLSAEQEMELAVYARYFNYRLHGDPDLRFLLPLEPRSADMLVKLRDGWLIAKFVNDTFTNTVDLRALTRRPADGSPLPREAQLENLQLAVESCRAIGIELADFRAEFILEPERYAGEVIHFVFLMVRAQLLLHVNVKAHPELTRMLAPGESAADLLRVAPEPLLVRWVNHHVRAVGEMRAPQDAQVMAQVPAAARLALQVRSFVDDPRLRDAVAPLLLLYSLSRVDCPAERVAEALALEAPAKRARALLALAREGLGLDEEEVFLSPEILAGGGQLGARLTLLFTASVFNARTGLEALSAEEVRRADLLEDDVGDTREERAFRLWINSLNIKSDKGKLHIQNLFGECRDGLVLLRIEDAVSGGKVDWKRVELAPNNKFKCVGNCNEVIRVGKEVLHLSLVNVGGTDLEAGNKKLTLSVVWQLMHFHITGLLSQLYNRRKKGAAPGAAPAAAQAPAPAAGASALRRTSTMMGAKGEDVDTMMIEWANERVQDLSPEQQREARGPLQATAFAAPFEPLRAFNDAKLANSLFFLHLLWAIAPRTVDWHNVRTGSSPEDRTSNARYAISVARKLGATIFLLPDDIVEVRPKMVISFVASILAIDGLRAKP